MYPVKVYLDRLRLAKRSDATIRSYAWILKDFARVSGIPIEKIHENLTTENLIKYAADQQEKGRSERAMAVRLRVLHRYYTINGVKLDPMEMNIIRMRITEEPEDRPISLELLQKMMDQADVRGKAIISFLISTGCRSGELCKLRVGDINGDTVKFPSHITKGKRGRTSYLTSEAEQFLSTWLNIRPKYLERAMKRTYSKNLEKNDPRLFVCSYSTLRQIWSKWYDACDGSRGKYGQARCTIHSTRRYFRTRSVQSIPLDAVEKIMGHSGAYLAGSYVRLTDEEIRAAFHAGEDVLYITRRDRRHSENALEIEKQQRLKLEEELGIVKMLVAEMRADKSQM